MVYEKPPGVTAMLSSGFTLRIGFEVTGPTLKHPNNEFNMRQRAVACIEASASAGLEELLISLDRFRKFLALGVGAPVEITMLRARCTLRKTIDIHADFPRPAAALERLRPDEMLFSLPAVHHRLQHFLKRWDEREQLLGPVYNLYDGTIRSSAMYVEHRFTSFFQAIESYHRRTVPNVPAKPGKKRARVSAKQRLTTVISNCDAHWLFIQPIDDAVNHLVDVRDYFTHYLPDKDKDVIDPVDLHNDAARLRLLLEMVLLHELGFDNQEIKKIFQLSRRSERFLVTRFN